MGLFSKIKKGLGVGVASVSIEADNSHLIENGLIRAKAIITAKSDISIKKMFFKVVRETQDTNLDSKDKRRDNKRDKLGSLVMEDLFDMKEGETKEIEFSVPIKRSIPMSQAIQTTAASFGSLGKLAGDLMTSKKFNYYISATVDVVDVALDPSSKKEIDIYFDVEKYKQAIKDRL